jgi:hypothetical protein
MPEPRASILVIADSADRLFVSPESIAELLHLEGINDIDTARLDALDDALLPGRSLIVLGPADPAPHIAQKILAFVHAGGGLVVMAPGEALAPQLGLEQKLSGIRNAGWSLPGFGNKPIVVRGWTQFYSIKQGTQGETFGDLGEVVADNFSISNASAGHAPLLQTRHGKGTIVTLAADLVTAVCLARQGDPLLAGVRSTGYARMRPADLFAGFDSFDTEQPSADLLCHLLRDSVHRAWPADSVLPWLWYFPDNHDTLMTLTSDDDWGKREYFEKLIACCDQYDARLTFYLTNPTVVDKKWFDELSARGYDFSLHPDLPPPTGETWKAILTKHVEYFRSLYGCTPATSIRNHCIAWSGYLHGTMIQHAQGFTWDSNYFTVPPISNSYMSRAGLPMRLINPAGDVLPVYQLPNLFSDETVLVSGMKFSLNLAPSDAVALVTRIIRENAEKNHSMITVNSHPISFATYSQPLWEPVLKFAKEQGVPVISVGALSKFWEARKTVRLRPIPRGKTFASPRSAAGQTAMIPLTPGETAAKTRTVSGRRFALVAL